MDAAPPTVETAGADGPAFERQVAAIAASGLLARSRHLARLFDFLAACWRQGRVPREIEVAIEGLGRDDDFDVTQDALVRVYIHKLRHRLEAYYDEAGAEAGERLRIPRGEYRLALVTVDLAGGDAGGGADVPAPTLPRRRFRPVLSRQGLLAVAGLLGVALLALALVFIPGRKPPPPWQPLFADDRPILLVVGDYYLFAEADRNETVRRLVRDFEINSPVDLANYLQLHPDKAASQFDVGLSYLPTSVAQALLRIVPLLEAGGKKPWGVVTSSELIPENLRNNHVVYIGHLSALGVLEDIVFARSGFHRGASYDELLDSATGKRYQSDSGVPGPGRGDFRHLAYLSSFRGPGGNHFVVVAGLRDAGLRELADLLASPERAPRFAGFDPSVGFEALYETTQRSLSTTPAREVVVRALRPVDAP